MDIVKKIAKLVGVSIIYSYLFYIDIYFCQNINNETIRNVMQSITLIILLYFSIIGLGIKGYVFEKYTIALRVTTQIIILLMVYFLNEILFYFDIIKL